MNHGAFASSQDHSHDEAKRIVLIVYILQATSFLVGVTYLVAAAINYLKWPLVADTWLEAHFRWQVNTFWFSLLWGVLGGMLMFVGVGYAILFANAVWVVYRIATGWLALNDNRPPV